MFHDFLVMSTMSSRILLIFNDVLNRIKFTHAVQNVVGAGQLLALAHRILFVSGRTAFIMKTAIEKKFRMQLETHESSILN